MSPSKIEWTEETWNPIVGCSIVSTGCINCYAMRRAHQLQALAEQSGGAQAGHYAGTTRIVNGKAVWTGKVAVAEHKLVEPLRRKKSTVYFVNSMSDLFNPDVPDEWIDRIFAITQLTPWHEYQVLTKRPGRMLQYFCGPFWGRDGVMARIADATWQFAADLGKLRAWPAITLEPVGPGLPNEAREFGWRRFVRPPFRNVHLGVTAERQEEADERRPALATLAAEGWSTFVSYEPALAPVDWTGWEFLGCAISGGETGPDARPTHPDWHRDLRDFCARHHIAYHFKQWGEWAALSDHSDGRTLNQLDAAGILGKVAFDGAQLDPLLQCEPRAVTVRRVGRARAGRRLDGVEHNGRPGPRPLEIAPC